MTRPRKMFDVLGDERIDHNRLVLVSADEPGFLGCLAVMEGCERRRQYFQGCGEIAERCRETPNLDFWMPTAQACQGKLGLHPTFAAHQLMPLIDHHRGKVSK